MLRYAALGLSLVCLAGCTQSGRVDADGLSYNERLEREANPPEPGAMGRVSQIGSDAKALADFLFRDAPKWVWDKANGRSPLDYAKKLRSPLASERRDALVNLAENEWARGEDYVVIYKDAAGYDPDPMVRAAGLRALNLSRADEPKVYVAALDAPETAVRLEAAKALANVPAERAVEPLLEILGDASADVDLRIAAADALRHYPQIAAARGLANATGDRDFGVAWQAAQSLRYLTGEELPYEPSAWLTYLAEAEKPFG